MSAHRPAPELSAPEAQPFHFAGGPHGVLLIHGFTGTAAHMRPISEALRDAGYTVTGIGLPGHGQTPEAMCGVGWQDWLEAARTACMQLRKTCPVVSAAGLSMGGVLALILAELGCVDSVATISAPMGVRIGPIRLARLAAAVKPRIWWRSDPQRSSQLDPRYDLGYPWFPTRSAADLDRLIRMARMDLELITCPVLVIQSRADTTVTAGSADTILSGVHSAVKDVLWLEDAPHVATISQDMARIAERLDRHFAENVHDRTNIAEYKQKI